MEFSILTSRIWEGAYILEKLLKNEFLCKSVLIQKTWWREKNSYDYSDKYIQQYLENKKSENQRYFIVEELIEKKQIPLHYIEDINSEESLTILNIISSNILIVVGSRIIKPNIIDNFKGLMINFHTGYLPNYRGPYSEFWAIFNHEYEKVATTIHLLDKGIDTGNILARETVQISEAITPSEAHVLNTINGAKMLTRILDDFVNERCFPVKQDETKAKYYSYPSKKKIIELEARLKKKIDISFAD